MFGVCIGCLGMVQQRVDVSDELAWVERFGEVVIGVDGEVDQFVYFVVVCG